MPIRVRFDKAGFYHPAFGRLGRGKNEGRIYVLPDEFGEKETIKVPIMDQTSKPPRQTGEKEITRYKNIPSSAEVIPDEEFARLEEEAKYDAELRAEIEVVKPKVATPEALEKVTGRGKINKAQDASERTTGRRRRTRSKVAEPTE